MAAACQDMDMPGEGGISTIVGLLYSTTVKSGRGVIGDDELYCGCWFGCLNSYLHSCIVAHLLWIIRDLQRQGTICRWLSGLCRWGKRGCWSSGCAHCRLRAYCWC